LLRHSGRSGFDDQFDWRHHDLAAGDLTRLLEAAEMPASIGMVAE
jgi:hypothetical protein